MVGEDQSNNLDRERLDLALQASGLAEFEWDIARDLFIVSPRMAAMTGLATGELSAEGGNLPYQSIVEEDRERVRAEVTEQVEINGRYEVEYRRIRPDDGREIWTHAAGVLVRDVQGRAERLIGVMQDITERKREEARREALMGELDHRVKNVLAAVQSLAGQTARRTTSLDAFLETFSGRLKAMAAANELLTAARWRGAAIADVAAAELGGLAQRQARWSGPELFLSPRAVNALALALHELATNAVKFGALSSPVGRIELVWAGRGDGGFDLTWTEIGGPPVRRDRRDGFGSVLLTQVTSKELSGPVALDWRPEGLTVRIAAGADTVVARVEPASTAAATVRLEATRAPAGGPRNLNGLTVLIVEDAVLLAMELETALGEAGAQVVGPAYDLAEALRLVEQPLDAAVLDVNLNGLPVTPVAERLRERGIPFVFATGYGAGGGAPAGFDAPIVRKPYDINQVTAEVAQLMGR